jgi:phosphoheptose isomerase
MTGLCTMTAVSNDLDYSGVFVNQLELLGKGEDDVI